jgi:hypothetical protein
LKPLAGVLDALNIRSKTLGTGLLVDSFSGALDQRFNGVLLPNETEITHAGAVASIPNRITKLVKIATRLIRV